MTVDIHANLEKTYSQHAAVGKDIFDRALNLTVIDQMRAAGLMPFYVPLDRNEGPEALIDGKRVIMLGSNNYLGLTMHPRVREAAARAARELGPSLTGSRLLNGTTTQHEELEREIADFVGKESAAVFTTGYQANLGLVTALAGRGAAVIMDRYDHASIQDAARMSGAQRYRYQHNDVEDLERVLAGIPAEVPKLVIVDGVFSMEGDLARLPEIVELCRRYGARLAVDDAHGFGVVGPGGRGTAAHYGLVEQVDLLVGTFSKSFASVGGFVAGDAKVVEYIKFFGRSMLFSASAPPPALAAAREALAILREEPERVERLNRNGRYLKKQLEEAGFDVGPTETPIIPVRVGMEIPALMVWRQLIAQGVYTNAVIYPAVPRGQSILRLSVTSEHTTEQLDEAVERMRRIGGRQGLLKQR